MSFANHTFYGNLTVSSGYFVGSGFGLTANSTPRNVLQTDTAYAAVYNDISGNLTSEAHLGTSRGGTGASLESASLNGVLKMTGVSPNETVSVQSIVNLDVDASAAIAWSKLASSGSFYQLVGTNGTGALTTTTGGSAGYLLVSGGAVATPSWIQTLPIANGGTGMTNAVVYAPICGGTTTTGLWQSANTGIGNAGYILTSTGASSLPTWQSPSSSFSSGIVVTTTTSPQATFAYDVTHTATIGVASNGNVTVGATGTLTLAPTGGTTNITGALVATTSISGASLSLTNALTVANGGTGFQTTTAYAPICGGTTATGTMQAATTGFSTTGYVLTSTGASSLPSWQAPVATGTGLNLSGTNTVNLTSPVVVANGGTGSTSLTVYAPMCGGTTTTAAVQSASTGIGNSGYLLTSNGASALPSWQAQSSSFTNPITVTSTSIPQATIAYDVSNKVTVSVSATGNLTIAPSGGTTNITGALVATTSISGASLSLTNALTVANGGTGFQTTTAYAPICGGTTATGAMQAATTGFSTTGYVLTSTGASSLPSWQAPVAAGTGMNLSGTNTVNLTSPVVVPNGGTGSTTLAAYAPVCGGTTTIGAVQSASTGLSNSGYVLTSNGASAVPSWQATQTTYSGTQYAVTYWSSATTLGSTTVGASNYLLVGNGSATPSWIQSTSSATASTIVLRDASGNASFNSTLITGSAPQTTVAPTADSVQTVCCHTTTTSGQVNTILTVTTASGYAGSISCVINADSATNAEDFGLFEAKWRWRVAAGQPIEPSGTNLTSSMKLIDRSLVSATYDVAFTTSGNNVTITVAHGNSAAATLHWTGRFDILHSKLS